MCNNECRIKTMKDQALIPNSQIETMFLRICTDKQMQTYVGHVDAGRINLATAYASNIVFKKFFKLVELEDAMSGEGGHS